MAVSFRRPMAAAGVLTVAASTVLVSWAAAAPAGATTVSVPAFFSGATQGDVVDVALNLPTAIGSLPRNLEIGLISARGTALHNSLGATPVDQSTSFAGLAGGTLVEGPGAPLAALDRHVQATLSAPTQNPQPLATLPSNPLATGTLGVLKALVSRADDSNLSSANLANIDIAKLSDLLPTAQLNTLSGSVQQIQQTVQSTVNQVVNTLGQLAGNDPTGVVSKVLGAAQTVQSQLPTILTNLQNTAVLKLDALDAHQSIGPESDGNQSIAHAGLLGLDVLGGLVHVSAFTSDATAFANGVAGGAHAASNPVVAQATVGNGVLGATFGPNGLNLSGAGGSVSPQVQQALNQLQSALNTVLATVGLSVTTAKGHSYASPDGRYATATGGALTIALKNPTANVPLLQVRLGGTSAEARAEQVAVTALHEASVTPRQTHLAFTGANLPLTGGVAVVLLATAALLRRRSFADPD